MDPAKTLTLPNPNLYEIIGKKEAIIHSLLAEIERLKEKARRVEKDSIGE